MSENRIWVEVGDFVRYFDGSVTPTGIGRVQAQILPWLVRDNPGRVSFCSLGRDGRSIDLLDYEKIRRLTDGNAFLQRQRKLRWALPLLKLQRYLRRRGGSALKHALPARSADKAFLASVRAGDLLVCLGSSWDNPKFGPMVRYLKNRCGMRFVLLVHDILPVSHSEFVSPNHIPTFTRWLHDMATIWDLVLTPSKSSADALRTYLEAQKLPVPEMQVIPFGAGFSVPAISAAEPPPKERSHVLYVSTIEIRKNHILLYRIWERLLREHGAETVPDLVFAGKYGWEIQELRQALRTSHFLDGKIRVVENLSDGELAELYKGARFTVFPSFCEGWGLPVSESLSYGRYCIASEATSLPEVGGRFVDYHHPADFDTAYRLIERAIFDPLFLEEKERLIHAEYPHPTWQNSASAIVAALSRNFPPASEPHDIVHEPA